jgi:tartrate dehydrogenase/decarboxylase/D-malate dehydrogenase
MLEHFGHGEEAQLIRCAVGTTTSAGVLPPDLGGTAKTTEVTASVVARIEG